MLALSVTGEPPATEVAEAARLTEVPEEAGVTETSLEGPDAPTALSALTVK